MNGRQILFALIYLLTTSVAAHATQGNHTIDEKEGAAGAGARTVPPPKPVKFGGALRFNYYLKNYDEGVKSRRGDLGFDIFRITANGKFDKLSLSVDYRFYSYMNAIHHGYVGYRFNKQLELRAGISQVPFGLLPYAAHNYWFGVPYFLGLADNYKSGFTLIDKHGAWDARLAFFKNSALGNASDLNRSSFDAVTVGAAANEETNTVDGRLAYTFGHGSNCENEVGMSARHGQLFNVDTSLKGSTWAGAMHLDSHCGRWNFQLEGARYGFDPRNPAGVSNSTITLGGFASSYQAAAHGNLLVANVAYNVPVTWPGVKLLTCYNDFSILSKDRAGFRNSSINTTGCLLQAGPTYTYIDLIRAKNMVYFGNGSLAGGGSSDWQTRFNVNFGIYW